MSSSMTAESRSFGILGVEIPKITNVGLGEVKERTAVSVS